jgi:hypothetical protein
MLKDRVLEYNLPGKDTVQIIINRGHKDEAKVSHYQLKLQVSDEKLLVTKE